MFYNFSSQSRLEQEKYCVPYCFFFVTIQNISELKFNCIYLKLVWLCTHNITDFAEARKGQCSRFENKCISKLKDENKSLKFRLMTGERNLLYLQTKFDKLYNQKQRQINAPSIPEL
ncbi:uncharacterized protein LOC111027334 [Myzus persicae]|uniref:uncharacterized protein LOC111027334 n=1 Tax=Myzus persicae TaxID=13164 RepID=UPI000B93576B|nr:uncharacterized protein LOC111027334 [Myzus persicae]